MTLAATRAAKNEAESPTKEALSNAPPAASPPSSTPPPSALPRLEKQPSAIDLESEARELESSKTLPMRVIGKNGAARGGGAPRACHARVNLSENDASPAILFLYNVPAIMPLHSPSYSSRDDDGTTSRFPSPPPPATGAKVRSGLELASGEVTMLAKGTVVDVVQLQRNAAGEIRARIARPEVGWMSRKTLSRRQQPSRSSSPRAAAAANSTSRLQ